MNRRGWVVASILFAIAMVTVIVIGWQTDKLSCQRQVPVREASNHRGHILQNYLRFEATLPDNHTYAIKLRREASHMSFLPVPNCSNIPPPAN